MTDNICASLINYVSATELIQQRVQEKICVWEQTHNRLKDGVEELNVQFKADCQSLEEAALKLDTIMTGKPDLSKLQFGKFNNMVTYCPIAL